jgi:hypothetical protein
MAEALLQAHPEQRVRGGHFAKGQSGNPAGRPRGSKHRQTLAAREPLDGEAAALTRQAVDMALAAAEHPGAHRYRAGLARCKFPVKTVRTADRRRPKKAVN